MENLIEVLEKSIEKNGNQQLTTQYLLNLLKYCDKIKHVKEINLEKMSNKTLTENILDGDYNN